MHKELSRDNSAETANYARVVYEDPLFHDLQM